MTTEPELIAVLKKLRYDLTDMQGKVSEALRMAAALDLPDKVEFICPDALCRMHARSAVKLAEHVYYSHGGPVPAHFVEAEARADEAFARLNAKAELNNKVDVTVDKIGTVNRWNIA